MLFESALRTHSTPSEQVVFENRSQCAEMESVSLPALRTDVNRSPHRRWVTVLPPQLRVNRTPAGRLLRADGVRALRPGLTGGRPTHPRQFHTLRPTRGGAEVTSQVCRVSCVAESALAGGPACTGSGAQNRTCPQSGCVAAASDKSHLLQARCAEFPPAGAVITKNRKIHLPSVFTVGELTPGAND